MAVTSFHSDTFVGSNLGKTTERRHHLPDNVNREIFGALRPYRVLKNALKAAQHYSRLHDRFRFDDRRHGSSTLICMLAGYKPDLWSAVLPRLEAALPEADVCIVSAGRRVEQLSAICATKGWSYLSTYTNDVSLAQNVCYSLHRDARMIVKIDEDMFLLPDTIVKVLDEYVNIKAEGIYDPGFVAPAIPLNGFSYRAILDSLDLLEEYESRFGTARIATAGIPIQTDPIVARWIWERTGPLAMTATKLAAQGRRRLACPIQFSIGLIAFEREFWELIGFFKVYRHRLLARLSTLGGDEAYLCSRGLELSRPAIVTTATVAGHFSFGPQYAGQKALLMDRPDIFH
jgi:hypothetical protein